MHRYRATPKVRKNDKRNADEFIREWVESVGSIQAAGKLAGLCRSHLYMWLDEPDRRMNPASTLKLSRAANVPVEALVFRWTPIGKLDLWKWLKVYK